MSNTNPYAATTLTAGESVDIRRVKIQPIELMRRSYELIRNQYWLFLAITVGGMVIGSAVPFGIIFGPMLVGIYLCYASLERGERVEFSLVFKGFDSFQESFIAFLVMMAFSIAVMIPLFIVMAALIMIPIAMTAQQNGGNAPPSRGIMLAFLTIYPAILVANILIAMPFLFTFQLIADRNMPGIAAIKMSFRGVMRNFWGVAWYMFVLMFVSVILALMCYVPAILFLPISFGSIFLLYRDVFPSNHIPTMPPSGV